jgi:hypothetical protein
LKFAGPLNPNIYNKYKRQKGLIFSARLSVEECEMKRFQFRVFLHHSLKQLRRNSAEYKSSFRLLRQLRHENPIVDQAIEELLGLFPNSEQVHFALAVASLAHKGQQYVSGAHVCPYLYHPIQVALILVNELDVYDEKIICACLLHDVLEKSGRYDYKFILDEFEPITVAAVNMLTQKNDIDYPESLKSIRGERNFFAAIAMAERLHHIRNMQYCAPLMEQYIATIRDSFIPIMDATYNPGEVYLMRQIKKSLAIIEINDAVKDRARREFLTLINENKFIEALELMKAHGEFLPIYEDSDAGKVDYRIRRTRLFVYLTLRDKRGFEHIIFRGN